MDNEEMSFEEMLNDSMKENKLEKQVTGTIIEINDKQEIFVDINYKVDGIIPKSEFSFDENADPNDEFKVGDKITAQVLKRNDGDGNVLLSYKRLQSAEAKKEFEAKVNADEIFEEKITDKNDNGLICSYKGIKIFIPKSLSNGITEGKVRFKIIEYKPEERKIVGSVKKVVQEERAKIENDFWSKVKEGDKYVGTVTSISSFGAFVDVEGVQGLLHVTEISWERNPDIRSILTEGQKINVTIKNLDAEHKRMKLSYDDKGESPWATLDCKPGDVIRVKIVKLVPFGAFAEYKKGVEALIHISQICEERITKPEEKLQIGQEVNAKVIDMDVENRKLELSIREIEGTSSEYSSIENVEENTDIAVADEKTEVAVVEENKEITVVDENKELVNTDNNEENNSDATENVEE